MAHFSTPLGQLPHVDPATTDPPDVQGDLVLLSTKVELRLMSVWTTRAARTAGFTAAAITPTDGMQSIMTDVNGDGSHVVEIDTRINGSWVKTYPLIYSGTGDPSNALGVVGDIYCKYS